MTRTRIAESFEFLPGWLCVVALTGAMVIPARGVLAATPAPEAGQQASREEQNPEALHLLVGRSLVLTSPARIQRVSVAEPNTIEVIVVNPNQVLINGKTPGVSSLVIWDQSAQSQTFDVFVDLDMLGLESRIHEVYPQENVKVEANRGVVTISGRVSSPEIVDKIMEMAKAVAGKNQVVSLMQVPTAPPTGEILLEVKFAELDRSALSQLGANFLSLPGAKNIGTIGTQQFAPPKITSLDTSAPPNGGPTSVQSLSVDFSDLLNVFIFRPDINLAATLKLLAQKNLLQILAEPNVLSETGKEASFLAGGEFPFPVLQGGAGFNAITIQFKEFGVKLNFTPTLTPDGLIHLKVSPEVSALDFTNALSISGFTIPAISTRRVAAEMVLKDGQSFAIAGLVNNQTTEQFQKIPGIGDVPILGKLFQSRSLNNSRNELIVMVTPHIVTPTAPPPLPPGPKFPRPFLPPSNAPATPGK
jgi:pilus assembly protein CpaC